jgi:uncharacterized protein involved in exopolysaccharide biosynthesis
MDNQQSEMVTKKVDLDHSMLEVFWRYKFLIIVVTIVGYLVGYFIAAAARPVYQARASFFALEGAKYRESGDPLVSAGQVSEYIVQTTEFNKSHSIATQLLLILYSRSLAKMVIDEMPEIADYMWPDADKSDPMYKDSLAEMLRGTVAVDLTNHVKPPVLVTTLGDPKLAVKLANVYLDMLRKFIDENSINNETKNRVYLETQTAKYREELEKAENQLKEFEISSCLVCVESQSRGALTILQGLKSELLKKMRDREVLKNSSTASLSEISRIEEEISILKSQIDFQEKGLLPEGKSADASTYVQLIKGGIMALPELASKHNRLQREIDNLKKIYGILFDKLELARLREKVEPTTFFVLDPAVSARQVAPNPKVQSTYGAMLGFLFSCCCLVIKSLFFPMKKI